MATTDKTTAVEILKQLGGNRFIVMTGAKNFGCTNHSMSFKIMRNAMKVTHVKITHNALDLYDMQFINISPKTGDMKVLSEASNIYNDMLQSTFTEKTGLYTKLQKR